MDGDWIMHEVPINQFRFLPATKPGGERPLAGDTRRIVQVDRLTREVLNVSPAGSITPHIEGRDYVNYEVDENVLAGSWGAAKLHEDGRVEITKAWEAPAPIVTVPEILAHMKSSGKELMTVTDMQLAIASIEQRKRNEQR